MKKLNELSAPAGRCSHALVLMCLIALAGPLQAAELQLAYEAYIAGVNAGRAEVQLTQVGDTYAASGNARSKGLWESIQRWRANFSVEGSLEAGQPVVRRFYSLQTTPRKRREIVVADGVLRETKNNKVRSPRPALGGFDLLTALFFVPQCNARAAVNTGRHGYTLERVSKAREELQRCVYRVIDDEGVSFRLTVDFRVIDGFRVPQRITGSGAGLRSSLVLEDSGITAAAASTD